MTLARSEREGLLEIAAAVTRGAAQIVEAGWRRRPQTEHKGPTDLVTAFDRASEVYLRDQLHARTSYPVVGEEHGSDAGLDARDRRAPTWFVDPIDGTTNFVHGHPFYCVSVGLVADGEPVLGVVVAPALRTEWQAIVGGAATRNGERCHVSSATRFGDALLATGFPYDRSTSADNNFDAFVSIKKKCQAVRRCGSAALDMCFVGDGTYDGYWERKLHVWDVAAGAAIVLAAGGMLSTYEGAAIRLGAGADVTRVDAIVATNGFIHDDLLLALELT